MLYVYVSVQNVINKLSNNHAAKLSSELSLAIIVPLLNEIERLPSLVKELDQADADKIIIVDGGSTDGSAEWLQKNWTQPLLDNTKVSDVHRLLINSSAGRAVQMNAGASHSEQDVLLFLHADTVLPQSAKSDVCATPLSQGSEYWGRFNVSFDEQTFSMSVIAFFINWRSRLTGVSTGDQAMFVTRTLFKRVGCFDDIALMEDVALSKKLRKQLKPSSLNSTVTTSARRWKKDGVARTVIKMWWYRLAYFLGVSPDCLANGYRNVR